MTKIVHVRCDRCGKDVAADDLNYEDCRIGLRSFCFSCDQWENATNGMIFEFKELEQAKAFAAAVKRRFHLDSRVFDDAKEAERAHLYPFVQYPSVVHVDRAHWKFPDDLYWNNDSAASKKAHDKAISIENQIDKLALKFGGTWIGT